MNINLIYEGNRNLFFEEALADLALNYKGHLELFTFSFGEYIAELSLPDETKDNFISDAKILIKRYNIKLNILGTWYKP